MTTSERDWIPVDACTMPTAEQPLRAAEFDSLFAETFTEAERHSPTRARLVLVGEPGLVARTQDLADRETQCCSFFNFAVTPVAVPDAIPCTQHGGAAAVHLDITVPETRADVLAALVDRAEAAAEAHE